MTQDKRPPHRCVYLWSPLQLEKPKASPYQKSVYLSSHGISAFTDSSPASVEFLICEPIPCFT